MTGLRAALTGATPLEPIDLLRLAEAKLDDGEARIQRVFEWQLERQALYINLALPVVVAALTALVSPFFKSGPHLSALQAVLLGAGALLAGVSGGVSMRIRAQALQRRYVAAINLYGWLRQVVP